MVVTRMGLRELWSRLERGWRRSDRWRWLLTRAVHRSGLGRFVVLHRYSYRIRAHRAVYSLIAWDNPTAGKEDYEFLTRVLRQGDVVVDVGANIGFITLAAAGMVGDAGRVYAIEPNPRTFRYLRSNVRLNEYRNVVLMCCAVGAASGHARMSDSPLDDINRVLPDGPVRVRLGTLDEILMDEKRDIRLLKVDVEGYEMAVFRGAPETLKRTQVVYFEASLALAGSYGKRVALLSLLGLLSWLMISVSYWNWYHFPMAFIAGEAIDVVLATVFAALAIAKIVPAPAVKA